MYSMQTDNSRCPNAEQPGGGARRATVSSSGHGVYAYTGPRKSLRQRVWRPMAVAAVVACVILGVQVGAAYSGAGNTLAVRIERQQPLTLDLRSGSAAIFSLITRSQNF